MIYAGVDIAKANHVIGAIDELGEEVAKPMPFKNSRDGFEKCVAWLESVAESQDDVIIGMEATGHYWQACFSFVLSCGYHVAVINPMQVTTKASIGFALGFAAASFEIRSYVSQIEFLLARVAEADVRIAALLDSVEPLILTIPGVSHTTGSQIIAEIGDVSRFKNAAAIVSYAGINSSVNQSGKFELKGGSITKNGSPYLRRALYLAAQRAYRLDPGLRAFYEKKRSEGKCHRVAVMAVSRKLCHIIYAILRDQVPFESRG